MTLPRILVLTLYSGENEFDLCQRSIAQQEGVQVTHEVIADLPNIEAHRALYARIMEQAKTGQYDWFIKLDADMVLMGAQALKAAIGHIETQGKDIPMAIFTVQDWPTGQPIWGMNVYSPKVRWPWVEDGLEIPDSLFVDPDPEFTGERLVVKNAPSPIAAHMPEPSDFQAFFFGIHRALKALAMDGNKPSHRAKIQWKILCDVGVHYRSTHNRKLAFILAGAGYASQLERAGALPPMLNKDDEALKSAYMALQSMDNAAFRHAANSLWAKPFMPWIEWYLGRGGWRLAIRCFWP